MQRPDQGESIREVLGRKSYKDVSLETRFGLAAPDGVVLGILAFSSTYHQLFSDRFYEPIALAMFGVIINSLTQCRGVRYLDRIRRNQNG